ncbi:hypothetical protein NEFER03_0417 [Nematocida sp. LUAm3]|nr:hypothetical protein NEFER03_0417 [Nematocida sp. LUAm3]KAI5175875.1 hypothetical protein NEFER02_1735 [Nematocida sp. LUAm2]KAI5178743.1 hypothetical protein NEFER01_1862 [Nematocida sp. LUAm1]
MRNTLYVILILLSMIIFSVNATESVSSLSASFSALEPYGNSASNNHHQINYITKHLYRLAEYHLVRDEFFKESHFSASDIKQVLSMQLSSYNPNYTSPDVSLFSCKNFLTFHYINGFLIGYLDVLMIDSQNLYVYTEPSKSNSPLNKITMRRMKESFFSEMLLWLDRAISANSKELHYLMNSFYFLCHDDLLLRHPPSIPDYLMKFTTKHSKHYIKNSIHPIRSHPLLRIFTTINFHPIYGYLEKGEPSLTLANDKSILPKKGIFQLSPKTISYLLIATKISIKCLCNKKNCSLPSISHILHTLLPNAHISLICSTKLSIYISPSPTSPITPPIPRKTSITWHPSTPPTN